MPGFTRPLEPLSDGVVSLRPIGLADADDVTRECQDPEISRWTTIPSPYALTDAVEWLTRVEANWANGHEASFAIVDAAQGALLGSISLSGSTTDPAVAIAGYWVGAASRGRGVATRALRQACEWGFAHHDLTAIELVTMVGNDASARVALKGGFRYVETIDDFTSRYTPGQFYEVHLWRLVRR